MDMHKGTKFRLCKMFISMYTRYFLWLCLVLIAKAIAIIFVIFHSGIGLGPDEAQYWTWSRHLDWGYYSKPPGIAWQIWLGTHLFGNTEFGVRSMAVVIGFLFPLLIFCLAKTCKLAPSTCFWTAIALALSPMGMMASFLSITDGGMMIFWTIACICIIAAIERDSLINYSLLGLVILCGALFKWTMYFLWPIVVILWRFYPRLASRRILLGITISLLALLPSIYWNSSHDWVTFRHVFSTLMGGHGKGGSGGLFRGNFFEFMGSQAALLSPILFGIALLALWEVVRKANSISPALRCCSIISLIVLATISFLALLMKIQGNWGIFAYPTLFIVLCWYACEKVSWGKKWLMGGIGLSLILCLFAFSIPYLQSHHVLSRFPISYRINPFRHNVGWGQLQKELSLVGYDPESNFLFGDKYQMASILSFYSAGQKRAYFFNLQGMRKNQFSFWPGLDQEQKGKRGFFVVAENLTLNGATPPLVEQYSQQLKSYFKDVRFLGAKPLFHAYGEVVKVAFIYECSGFLGRMPQDPELY